MPDRSSLEWGADAAAARLPYVYLSLAPLWERFRLGEGMLLAVNACVLAFAAPPLPELAARLGISLAVLAVLYAVNDLVDCEADRANPKKNRRLVAAFLEHRRGYTVFLVALHAALVAAGFAHDPHLGSVVAAMLAVNAVYSLRAKGLPLLDVAVVALWGGLFTALSGASFAICALVGLLTLVMHVFQMDVDREVDAANRVRTSVVASGRTPALVAGACALLAAGLFAQLGPLWAASAAVPLLAERLLRTTEAAWMLSRIYAGVVLLAAIGTSHAGS